MEERKSNKKTRGIIIAAILVLLLAILALCGTTFARYITQTSKPAQQATVAKWGFVANINTDNLFGDKYQGGTIFTKTESDTDKADVKAAASANKLVAPGTKGSMTFSVTGSAEVLAKITANMDATKISEVSLKDNKAGEALNTTPYTPIVWKLETGTDGSTWSEPDSTIKTLAAIATEINKLNKIVEPGSAAETNYYRISWEWAMGDANVLTQNNIYDTILGYAAKGAGTYGQYTVAVVDETKGTYTVVDNRNTTDTADDVTYTATIKVAFDLTVGVMQIQDSDRPSVEGA